MVMDPKNPQASKLDDQRGSTKLGTSNRAIPSSTPCIQQLISFAELCGMVEEL